MPKSHNKISSIPIRNDAAGAPRGIILYSFGSLAGFRSVVWPIFIRQFGENIFLMLNIININTKLDTIYYICTKI